MTKPYLLSPIAEEVSFINQMARPFFDKSMHPVAQACRKYSPAFHSFMLVSLFLDV